MTPQRNDSSQRTATFAGPARRRCTAEGGSSLGLDGVSWEAFRSRYYRDGVGGQHLWIDSARRGEYEPHEQARVPVKGITGKPV
jgi:hypothetical protein